MDALLPFTLVIDSVSAACSAALIGAEGEVVDERHEVVGRGHAERLVPMIGEMLGGRVPASILVDCGPGSFTGLRVGLAAAHGLAIGWGVPLAGYSAPALLATMAGGGGGKVAAAVQGGHGEIFVQSFAGHPLEPADLMRSLRPQDAAMEIDAALVVGSGAEQLVAARGWGEAIDLLPRAAWARHLPPTLRSLPARPIYGRAPDARPMSAA
jgi:tRNA threonylcarbamoyl adenosine modification protein YeaZ